MRIFVLVEDPYEKHQNPYVRTLIDGINCQYNDVSWGYGLSAFWDERILEYDIIHIHWPDIFTWYNDPNLTNAIVFEERLKYIKTKGIKVITTCHNLKPHYSDNEIRIQVYDIAYNNSDCIIHLGKCSLELFEIKYPNKEHYLLMHHTYDTIYTQLPSHEESINRLRLDPSKKYILCFGAFRDDEERNLIIQLAKYLRGRKVNILAPSFYKVPEGKHPHNVLKPLLRFLYYKFKHPNIKINKDYFVNNEMLAYYYGASSISLIQRTKILNSGNVPLGFYMKNIVVGPNLGNVGTWLQETQNPTFNPNDINTLYKAIDFALENNDKGMENYLYAINNLNCKKISSELYYYYKRIIRN